VSRLLRVYDLGILSYHEAMACQASLEREVLEGATDCLVFLEHTPVITFGRNGGRDHLRLPEEEIASRGIEMVETDRGGNVTYHAPGQLVGYPILRLDSPVLQKDLHRYVRRLEEALTAAAADFGVKACRKDGLTGVWVGERKLASIGIRVRRWVSTHGFALNVCCDLSPFNFIDPCGMKGCHMINLSEAAGRPVTIGEAKKSVLGHFLRVFGYGEAITAREGDPCDSAAPQRRFPHPVKRISSSPRMLEVESLLRSVGLHTVCEEASCPNIYECYGQGRATFLILGDTCTRRCTFCGVKKGKVQPVDPAEAERVAAAVQTLGLSHVVVTSVTRDDLPDGGAAAFARTVEAIRDGAPSGRSPIVELLVPDFGGKTGSLKVVLKSRPDILGHNVETVPRLYPVVRPGASYERSLALLKLAKTLWPDFTPITKSGLMLGLGETKEEVLQVLRDLRSVGCDALTVGQYLPPSPYHLPVSRITPSDEFAEYGEIARELGFSSVQCGTFVRSSYARYGEVACR